MKDVRRIMASSFFFLLLFPSLSFAALSTKTKAPDFQQINNWVDSTEKISLKNLEGNVVLISFWSPSNAQSLRQISILSKWYKIYKASVPFEVLGIAVPEFQFEKDTAAEELIIKKLKIPFPVAIDTSGALRNAYQASEIPTVFLTDSHGRIRNSFPKLLDYETLDNELRTLFREASAEKEMPSIEKPHISHSENIPELYFGYKKLFGYGNSEKLQAELDQIFKFPENYTPYQFYLNGGWRPKEESMEVGTVPASVKILFRSRRANLLAGSPRKTVVPAEVRLDGHSIPKELKGKDVVIQEGKSFVLIREYRFYKLLRLKEKSGDHYLEIICEEPGIEILKASFD